MSRPMEDEEQSPLQEPPAKKQRNLACQRCRSRKQKCEDNRPCGNCVRGGEECLPTQPAPRLHVESEYVRVLEERIAELESLDPQQSLDHLGGAHSRIEGLASVDTSAENGELRPSAQYASLPVYAMAVSSEEEPDPNHFYLRLLASPSTQDAVQNDSATHIMIGSHHRMRHIDDFDAQHKLTTTVVDAHAMVNLPLHHTNSLLEAYRERAQAQYPFFYWDMFLTWHSEWKHSLACDLNKRAWQGFFVNLVYATSLMLQRKSHVATFDMYTFYSTGLSLLPAILQQPDKILQVQAYLLLSVYALHQSSTERIITLASTTMRLCVQQQLHLAEVEPQPLDVHARLRIQIRRRCFWCAYTLDRLVMSAFDLPPSVSDQMITVRPFANIEDRDLLGAAAVTSAMVELADDPKYTCMSPALHILQCRRIQSEISAVTLRSDYYTQFESTSEWRVRILAELEKFKSRVQRFSDPQSKGYTSQRWQAMIYYYTLLMLYRPTKANVLETAGDWSVQASTQACLMFRKSQIDRQIAQPWLALIVQFQSGITLLYCFWATAPEHRTDKYNSLDVPDALRACSNILAIMADRWAKADCLRDVFELLVREIPLVDHPNKPPVRLTEKASSAIKLHLPQVRALVVHRPVLRMIEEMISEDFPRSLTHGRSVAGVLGQADHGNPIHFDLQSQNANDNFQMPFASQRSFEYLGTTGELESLHVDGPLSFPGVFDLESWI
ncbi:Fungal-trans multi-domain protein [Pyrenophora tritici-repentis]|nr:Fungal-trans multi-domain protein [Pyrenophora tritici-repentis]